MLNFHIYPSTFTHESRILKEAGTLRRRLGFNRIELIGVSAPGLPGEEAVDDVTTIRRFGPAKGTGAAKAVRHLIWCLHVLWHCLRRRPQCVNCHSLPVLPVGVLVKLLTGARLVYDAHELETETVGSRGLRRRLSKALERSLIGAVDLLIVVSPGIETWYRDAYRLDRVVTLLNAPPYAAVQKSENLLRKFLRIPEGVRIVLYQGVLGPYRGVEELVAAAPLMRAEGYALVLMGYGPMVEALREQARATGDFYIHPAVAPDVLLAHTRSADIGVCLIQDGCLSYRLCLPNKLFEYVTAGLPVVASDLPEMKSVIEGEGIGHCIRDWQPADILDAVKRADAMTGPDLDVRLDAVARAYSWEVQEDRLVEAYRRHIL